jgi:hypothetical protein
MNANVLKLVACVAWACVAISSATPANARIVTSQTGQYAACSANYGSQSNAYCFEFPYYQQIKLTSRFGMCASGGTCTPDNSVVQSEWVYPTGRKTATIAFPCGGGNTYELDTCSC